MSRLRIALAAVLVLAALAGASRATGAPSCEISFKPATTGNWSVAANWDLGRLPADGEDVCIPLGSTATLSTGTVRPGAMSVAGTMVWSGGTINGAGTTTIEPGGRIEHTAVTALEDGRVLEVKGTLELKTAGTSIDDRGASRTAITVAPGGAVKRTATGAGIVTLRPAVENAGSLTAEAGQLDLAAGGPASTGTFGAAGQAGTVRLSAGTFQLAGARWLGGVTLGGNNPAVNVASGALTLSGTNTFGSGTLTGALTIASGTLAWSGGTMKGAGPTTVAAAATLRQAGAVALEDARVLDNQGTFDLDAASTFVDGRGTGTSEIRNGGLIRRTASGAGPVSLYPALLNTGTVRADNGPLELRGGSATPSTGHFGPGGGATVGKVRFAAGTWTLAQGADLLGDVEITGATVAVPQGATVPAAGANRLVTGSVAGTGTLDVTGTLELAGGRMTDAGRTHVAPGGTLVVNGTVSVTGGRTIDNDGLVDMAGDRILSDDLPAPPELLDNRPGGTVRKTAGTGPSMGVLGLPLRNDGTVESLSGVLKVEDGGPTPDTGTFHGASRANRVLLGGGRTLDGDVSLEGTVEIGSFSTAVSVVAGETVVGPPDLLRTGGDFSGNLRVTGIMTWSGGRQAGLGTTTIAPGATLRIDGLTLAACASVQLADGHRLRNEGLVRFEPGADLFASSPQRPRIDNAATIQLDGGAADPCGAQTGILGGPQVTNTGTIEKVAGISPALVSGALDNDGAVASRAGDLELDGDPAALQAGTFATTGAGSTITLAKGRFTLEPGAAVTGHTVVEGLAELAIPAGMTLPIPTADRLDLQGTLSGAGKLRVAGALEVAALGKQVGPGTTQIAPGGTLSAPAGANATLSGDRALVNQGAATVAGRLSIGQGSAVVNEGSLTMSGTGKVDGAGGYGTGASGLLHNAGTLTKAGAGEGEVAVTLDNDGTIVVAAGVLVARGLLDWTSGASSGPSEGSVEVAAGTLVVPGPLKANAARLVLDGPASAVVYPDTASPGAPRRDALASLTRNAAGGELVLRGGRSLTVGGTFANQGVLELGAGSTLGAAGFSQSAGAVLRPAVTTGGAGIVAVTGTATLGGRLDTPAPVALADDVTVLTASVVSDGFAAVTGGYEAVVGPANVVLRKPAELRHAAQAAPTPGADLDALVPLATAHGVVAPTPSAAGDDAGAPALHRRAARQRCRARPRSAHRAPRSSARQRDCRRRSGPSRRTPGPGQALRKPA